MYSTDVDKLAYNTFSNQEEAVSRYYNECYPSYDTPEQCERAYIAYRKAMDILSKMSINPFGGRMWSITCEEFNPYEDDGTAVELKPQRTLKTKARACIEWFKRLFKA